MAAEKHGEIINGPLLALFISRYTVAIFILIGVC